MPSKKEYTCFSLPCLMLLVLATLTGCSSDLDPTPSATTGDDEAPAFKAFINADTSLGTSGRVTQVFVRLFDVSGGDETSIALLEGDTLSATTSFLGKTYDFGNNIRDWSAAIISDTDATATTERDSETESLQLNPAWDDAISDIIAVVATLYRPVDFNAADLSLEINVPEAYVTDGRMQVRVFLRDAERVDAFFDLISASELTGGNWYTVDISNINSSLLQADTGFDLRSVLFFGVQFISNGKAVDIDDSILIDNVSVSVTPMEQTNSLTWDQETNAFSLGRNSNNELVYATQFSGGIDGRPLTVSVNRSTMPSAPWFPADDSSTPDFTDWLFNAPDSTINLPLVEVTSPRSSDDDDEDTHYLVGTDSVTIEWQPSGSDGTLHIEYLADCSFGFAYDEDGNIPRKTITGDPGTVTFLIDDFLQEHNSSGSTHIYQLTECTVSFYLVKETTGTMDPTFISGSKITAKHSSFPVTLITTPPL